MKKKKKKKHEPTTYFQVNSKTKRIKPKKTHALHKTTIKTTEKAQNSFRLTLYRRHNPRFSEISRKNTHTPSSSENTKQNNKTKSYSDHDVVERRNNAKENNTTQKILPETVFGSGVNPRISNEEEEDETKSFSSKILPLSLCNLYISRENESDISFSLFSLYWTLLRLVIYSSYG